MSPRFFRSHFLSHPANLRGLLHPLLHLLSGHQTPRQPGEQRSASLFKHLWVTRDARRCRYVRPRPSFPVAHGPASAGSIQAAPPPLGLPVQARCCSWGLQCTCPLQPPHSDHSLLQEAATLVWVNAQTCLPRPAIKREQKEVFRVSDVSKFGDHFFYF